MKKIIINQKGFGIIGALMSVVFIAGLGVTATSLMSSDQNTRALDWSNRQALQVQQAGLEYAAKKTAAGQDPTVNNKAFGPGSFSISRSGNTITVASTVGSATKSRQATMAAAVPPPSIVNGYVNYPANQNVTFKVLCAEISQNGNPVPVKMAVEKNGTTTNLFNNQGVVPGGTYTTTSGSTAAQFRIKGTAMISPSSVSYWSNNTVQSRQLVNGAAVPNVPGFAGQSSISQCVAPYIQNNRIALSANQVIVLFELGVSGNSTSAANDFQDLVVLMTGAGL